MRKIKFLEYKVDKSGRKRNRSLFLCPICNLTFNMRLDHGKKAKTCKKCKPVIDNITHGMSNTRLYSIWEGIKHRCYTIKPYDINYKYYRGKGIIMCDSWKDFINFYAWAKISGYKSNLTIDRIKSSGNYTPNNCRWSTRSEQSINTSKRLNTSSKYRGVCFYKRGFLWQAEIKCNNKRVYLGRFKVEVDAAIAYNKYVLENKLTHPLNIITLHQR